ncbi:MAG: hypothetical protein PHE54_02780 [Bacilli bacterium]|nr:hypothetical protein [Bacilli bacterium]
MAKEKITYRINENNLIEFEKPSSEIASSSLNQIGLYAATYKQKQAREYRRGKDICYVFSFNLGKDNEKLIKVFVDAKDPHYEVVRQALHSRYANFKNNERIKICAFVAAITIALSSTYVLVKNRDKVKAFMTGDGIENVGVENIDDYKGWASEAELDRIIQNDIQDGTFYENDEIGGKTK